MQGHSVSAQYRPRGVITVTTAEGWEPVQRLRTYEQVMSQIEERILDQSVYDGAVETHTPAGETVLVAAE